MIVILIVLASIFLFAIGMLVGTSLETHGATQRSRRLALIQRKINTQVRELEAAGRLDATQAELYSNYEIECR